MWTFIYPFHKLWIILQQDCVLYSSLMSLLRCQLTLPTRKQNYFPSTAQLGSFLMFHLSNPRIPLSNWVHSALTVLLSPYWFSISKANQPQSHICQSFVEWVETALHFCHHIQRAPTEDICQELWQSLPLFHNCFPLLGQEIFNIYSTYNNS